MRAGFLLRLGRARFLLPAAAMIVCLATASALWLPFLPNRSGWMGPDYAYWLPNLLAGYYWHLGSPWWAMPWFSPAECGGVPLHANPQGAYLSLPQGLVMLAGPVAAVRGTFLITAAMGYAGAWYLARVRFATSRPAAWLIAGLFTFNGLFAVRMVVGHLSFAPFMLAPAMAACLLCAGADRWHGLALRICGFGVLLAICLQAGMAVLVPPVFLSLLIAMAVHRAAVSGGTRSGLIVLAAGTVLGLCLCAGKLAAVGALLANMPRDFYPLPGFRNVAVAALAALRGVFFWPAAGMSDAIVNSRLRLELHEFDYRAGPVPLLLLAAWAWFAWRGRPPGAALTTRRRVLWGMLLALLAFPLALNTLLPGWTPFLKSLPIIGSSSSLLRWFAAYILPACLAGGLALDRLAARDRLPRHFGPWAAAGCGLVLTALNLLPGRGFYGPAGIGTYDPAQIVAAYDTAAATGVAPPIAGMTLMVNDDGSVNMSLARQDALTQGMSQITCYEPLFGYHLEHLPDHVLHPGRWFEQTQTLGGARLNVINPACYVFPGANGCFPGDAFKPDQAAQAAAFVGYLPFSFAKPGWAVAADWLGIASLAGTLLAMGVAWFAARRGSRPA